MAKKYRVFISIEEEDDVLDTFDRIDDTCLGVFNSLEEAHNLCEAVEDTYL